MSIQPVRSPLAAGVAADGTLRVVLSTRPLAVAATLASIAVMFAMSPKLLTHLGISYPVGEGSPLAKIHPASYLAVLALLLWIPASGGPARFVRAAWRDTPGVPAFGLGVVVLALQAVAIQHLPASAVVDTFVLPLALFVAIRAMEAGVRDRAAAALLAFLAANSLLGLVEVATGWRLTPFYVGSEIVTYDWRATALLGHPLSNAMITGVMLILLAGGATPLGPRSRFALIALHLTAMAAFGGRAAALGTVAILVAAAALHAGAILAGRRFRLSDAALTAAALTAAAIAGLMLFDGGAFDPFLQRFVDDSGSAETRIAMLGVFEGQSIEQILFAPDLSALADTQRRLDLAIGIESFVVAFVAYYGTLVTLVFFAALAAFSVEIVRALGPAAVLPLLFFFAMSATSTGIASKTTDFALVVAMLMLLVPACGTGRPRSAVPFGARRC